MSKTKTATTTKTARNLKVLLCSGLDMCTCTQEQAFLSMPLFDSSCQKLLLPGSPKLSHLRVGDLSEKRTAMP